MNQNSAGRGPRLRRLGAGVAGAAVLIGVVTAASRVVGFGRYLVFSHTLGQTCLGDVYLTANQLPTLVFEAVAGGALTSLMVPVLALPVARRATDETGRIVSALLTWTLVVLTPLVIAGMLAAGPTVRWLLGGECAGAAAVGTRMLLFFLPQLLLYGVAVVLYGVLQAHRRFLGPALAPLVNSLVLVGSYLWFAAAVGGRRTGGAPASLVGLGLFPQLVLALGATCGVAALTVTAAVPATRLGLRIRPTLAFPPGVAGRVRALAAAGVATVSAQQVVVAAVLWLANHQGPPGSVALYTYAWQLFHLPYAILAVPVALSAFPVLSARASAGDTVGYAATTATVTRVIVLLGCASAAVLAAVAGPVARLFLLGAPGATDPVLLRRALLAFAPGLLGFSLVAHAGRALYAAERNRVAAASVVTGWAVVLVADVALAVAFPPKWVVTAFGMGSSMGMTVAGAALLVALGRGSRDALRGVGRALLAGLFAGGCGYLAGASVAGAIGPAGLWGSLGLCFLAAATVVLVYAGVAALVDRRDMREAVRRWSTR